jgi:hypothetical protein
MHLEPISFRDWDAGFSIRSVDKLREITVVDGKGKKRVRRVPESIFSDERELTSVIFDGDLVYLAMVDEEDPTGRVMCFSTNKNRIVWTVELTDYASTWYRGSTAWFIELSKSKNGILAFHACDVGFLIEEIESVSGKKRCVMSSLSSVLK